jgi:hypothetical protein
MRSIELHEKHTSKSRETIPIKQENLPKFIKINNLSAPMPRTRVSSKQSKIFFGSNRNKPKLGLFRLIFGLFRETNKLFFRFVSVRFGISDPYRNNRNKQKCFETHRNNKQYCGQRSKSIGTQNCF